MNGYTWHSNTTPDQGELRSWNWQRLQLDVKDLSAALQPVTVYNELLTIPFPATAGEARADAFSNVTRVDLAWNAHPDAYADYYLSPELEGYGFSHAAYLSTRAWLHLPPLPIAQQLPFLKVTRYAQDGYDPNDFEESFEAEAVSLTVPANQSYSTSIDLDTSASGIAGTSSANVELRQIRIIPGSGMVGDRRKPAPGAAKPHTFNPAVAGDDATRKWDVSRQIQVTIQNPGGVNTQGLTPAAWYANQPQPEATPVAFPGLDVEGNDDPKLEDEDGNPYGPCTRLSLEHEKGEISSSDFPKLSIGSANGVAGAFFAKELDFREFARLELWDGKRKTGQFWFRISAYQKWHHHLRTTFNGTTPNWENTGSSADQDD